MSRVSTMAQQHHCKPVIEGLNYQPMRLMESIHISVLIWIKNMYLKWHCWLLPFCRPWTTSHTNLPEGVRGLLFE